MAYPARSGHSGYDAVRAHPANAVIAGVGDVQASIRAQGDLPHVRQFGRGGRATVAATAISSLAGYGGYDAVRAHPANALLHGSGDVQTAVRGHGHVVGSDPGRAGGPAIAAVSVLAGARHGLDRAGEQLLDTPAHGAVSFPQNVLFGLVAMVDRWSPATQAVFWSRFLDVAVGRRAQCAQIHHANADGLGAARLADEVQASWQGEAGIEVAGSGVVPQWVVVGEHDGHRRVAGDMAAIGVPAIPVELVPEIGLGGIERAQSFAGNRDFQFDVPQAVGDLCARHRDHQGFVGPISGRSMAAVVQPERGSDDANALPYDLALDFDYAAERAIAVAAVELRSLGHHRRGHGVRRRAVGPVAVPGGEMVHCHPPQALARGVKRGQLLEFRCCDAQGIQRGLVGCCAAAVDIEHGVPGGVDGHNFDDPAVFPGEPLRFVAIVIAHWNNLTGGKAEVVVDVEGQRLAEIDPGGACLEGFIHTQFHGVGVAAGGRQGAGHGREAALAHGVLGGAHGQVRKRHAGSIVGLHGCRGMRRNQQRGPATALGVRLHAAPGHLQSGMVDGDRGHQRIQWRQDHVGCMHVVAPGGVH